MSKLDVLNEGRSQGFLTEDGFLDRKSVIDEHGTDRYGAEFKRTSNDFRLRYLTQDNCVCGICHGVGAKWEFVYVTRNYRNPRTKRICKTLQAEARSFWICPRCLENLNALTGLEIGEVTNE